MKRLRRIFRTTLILVLILCGAGFGTVGWLGSSHLISPPRRPLQGYHHEILSHPSEFGLSIHNWTGPRDTPCLVVLPAPLPGLAYKSRELRKRLTDPPNWGEVRGTVVLLHGHQGRKEDHLPICERFCAAGFRCLLPDLPAHGDHPEAIARFGFDEASLVEDLLDACAADLGFTDQNAFLFGVSQGGAVALQTAARNPDRWAGAISVAAFASLDEAMRGATSSLKPPFLAPVAVSAVSWTTRMRAGFFPETIRPVSAARMLTLPTLIIHGENDRFIGPDQGRRIFEALPSHRKQLLLIPNAGHGRVLAADASATYATCCNFLLEANRNARVHSGEN